MIGRHPYDVSKSCADLLAQMYAKSYDLPVCVTRCGNFFGGGDLNWNRIVPGTIRSVLRGERPVIRSDGQFTRDYLYVEDGAARLPAAGRADGGEAGAPRRGLQFLLRACAMTVLELVAKILAVMGSDARAGRAQRSVERDPGSVSRRGQGADDARLDAARSRSTPACARPSTGTRGTSVADARRTARSVILCGGAGTRLAEETETRPKPLVEIGGRPILWHIMKHYSRYGFNEFVLALGHKGDQIKRYFLDYHAVGQDMTISLQDGQVAPLNNNDRAVDGPPRRHRRGDADRRPAPAAAAAHRRRDLHADLRRRRRRTCRLDELLAFHRSRGALATLTAVRPPARFGALEFDGDRIRHFKEKSTLHEGWINGGFFVVEPAALKYIESDVMWEHAPMEALAADGQLVAYRHEDFWQCMDTLRDLRYLESLWDAGRAAVEDLVAHDGAEPPGARISITCSRQTGGLWEELRGARLFVTGGTGFFGCWLLETFLWANDQLKLGASAVVLDPEPAAPSRRKAPHLASHPASRCSRETSARSSFPTRRSRT